MTEHGGMIRGVRCEIICETRMLLGVTRFMCRWDDRVALVNQLLGRDVPDGPYRIGDDPCLAVQVTAYGPMRNLPKSYLHPVDYAIVAAYFGPPGSMPELPFDPGPEPDPGPYQSWRDRPSFLGGTQ